MPTLLVHQRNCGKNIQRGEQQYPGRRVAVVDCMVFAKGTESLRDPIEAHCLAAVWLQDENAYQQM
jgi:hypothetical protein